jgi:hypothetical protein
VTAVVPERPQPRPRRPGTYGEGFSLSGTRRCCASGLLLLGPPAPLVAGRVIFRHIDPPLSSLHPDGMIELSEQQIIDQIADRLAGIHPEISPEAVTRVAQEEHARFNGRPVRDFVPLFVERHAKAELAKLVG